MEVARSVQDYFATIEGGATLTPPQVCARFSPDNRRSEPCLERPVENLVPRDELRFSFAKASKGKAGAQMG
eukprot:1349801-Pyramimonas_sp.AAC.1